MNCLQCFSSKEILKNHCKVCLEIDGKQASKMPGKGSNIFLTGRQKQLNKFFCDLRWF